MQNSSLYSLHTKADHTYKLLGFQQLAIIPKSSTIKLGKITLLSLAPTENQVVAHPASFNPFQKHPSLSYVEPSYT
jgi:hypothetical protein